MELKKDKKMKVLLLVLFTTSLFSFEVTFTLPKICTAELIHKKNGKVVYIEKVGCKTIKTKDGVIYQAVIKNKTEKSE